MQKYGQSVADQGLAIPESPPPGQSVQYVADNVDQDTGTLDDRRTFHSTEWVL